MRRAAAWVLLLGGLLGGAGEGKAEERPSEEEMFGGGKEAGVNTGTATETNTGTATETNTGTATETNTGTATETNTGTATGTGTSISATTTPSGGFGTDSPPHQPPSATRTPGAATTPDVSAKLSGEEARDELMLGTPGAGPRLSDELAPEDPLRIGGQIYLRGQVSGLQGQAAGDYTLSSPSLLDVYMDVRPNDRVRGFALGRMSFDPTLPQTADQSAGLNNVGAQGGYSSGVTSLNALLASQATRTPRVALDQLWLRFDIKHRVFVTAGRQHVRWGTARFWTPTDYLHIQRRNPLDVFDARTGTNMVKLHIPWEEYGWNFYAYGITENTDATRTASKVAGAARVEVVLGTSELGAGVFARRGQRPKLAADLSTGIWDLDFYGEVAARWAEDIDRVSHDRNLDPTTLIGLTSEAAIDKLYPVARGSGVKVQATGGVSYSIKYADKDVFTLGAEYFYNQLGYSDTAVYPGLILSHVDPLSEPASFFYLGRHYAGVFALLPAPGSWDRTSFTLSSLANISDRSGITRLDYSFTLLTHLRFEAFGAVHWGEKKGEFRFGTDRMFGVAGRSPTLFNLGLGLRMAI